MEQLSAIVVALSIINLLAALLVTYRSQRAADEVKTLLERISRLEAHREHAPDNDDLTEIREALSAHTTDMAALNARWETTNRMLHTIQEHLLQEDKKK